MADTRGTWSLSEAWAEKGAAEWVPIPNVWVTPAESRTDTCYWVAGVQNNTPTSNTVDKTNIPGNTTAQVPGLTNVMPGHWKGGHSSGTAGYSAGGREPQQSKIGKITYATDGGEILSTYLTAARGYVPIGFCNDTFGWFLGGGEPGTPWPVAVSKVDKMTFATEAVALLPGTQLHTALNNTTTSGNTTKGYYAGGQGPTSKIGKIEYSSDTNTLIPSTIPTAMYRGAGTTNGEGTIGYYIGGAVPPGMSYTSNCTKHVYATDTISDVTNGRQYNPRGTNAGSGNQTYALSAGGYYYPGGLAYSSIDRMAYSNETSSRQPGLDMSTSRRRQGAHGARTYGRGQTYDGDDTRWFDSASTGSNGVDFDGSGDYLHQTVSDPYALRNWWGQAWTVEYWIKADAFGQSANGGSNVVGVTNHSNTGESWSFGPKNDGEVLWYYYSDSSVRKMESGKTLSTGQWYHLAFVFDGSTSMKIFVDGTLEHSEEVIGTPTGSSTTFAIGRITASGNDFNGRISNLRIAHTAVYSNNFTIPNETLTNITGTKLLCCQSSSSTTAAAVTPTAFTASGDPTAFSDTTVTINQPPAATPTPSTTLTGPEGIKAEGYLIQGIQGPSTSPTGRTDVYRLNYNTDTWDSSVYANSILTRKNAGATSNTTNAYIAGGTLTRVVGGTNHGNAMDKLTYATSTMTRIPSSDAGDIPGPGSANKQCAAGNQTQGYWAFGPAQSLCSKLTYSSETGSNLPNLPWNAKNSVGVSMQTAGYYGSGDGFDDENTSFVRITFSNDSYAAYSGWFYTPGGFGARYRCGSSSSTKAYIVGGQNATRCMDVIPWANNTTTNSPTTFLQSPGYYKAPGQGSNEAGYFTGGANVGDNGTRTEKITYSTDTTAILPGAYFPTSEPNGVNSYSTGGPNMNGLGTNVPNVI